MECVIERYKVPEEKKWTGSLMRTLALMQMGIDYHCRSVRRYLTLTGEECVCVCLHVRGHGCVFILRSIRCLFHLLHLSLYEQSLIILLSALMEFFGVFFPTYTYFFFKSSSHTENHTSGRMVWLCAHCICVRPRAFSFVIPDGHLDRATERGPCCSICSAAPLQINIDLCPQANSTPRWIHWSVCLRENPLMNVIMSLIRRTLLLKTHEWYQNTDKISVFVQK